ncbi:hypothetical protein YPPY08_0501, partial [Yersinia pestis PY-08]
MRCHLPGRFPSRVKRLF